MSKAINIFLKLHLYSKQRMLYIVLKTTHDSFNLLGQY